jgi:phosphoribosyl-ATP pyrophosphohydrolase/phosphoribosyl-AMP cyclohydrolase
VPIQLDEKGLIPAVVQDADTSQVLMLGWMSRESIDHTYRTGHVTFWSRSRKELWEKGATSGNWLNFVSLHKNCEDNSFLVLARPAGPTCHTGNQSCYYREVDPVVDLP